MTAPADGPEEVLHTKGLGPFVTERHILHRGQRHVWRSRPHRRGLQGQVPARDVAAWRPERLNPWIGSGFLVGSAFFAACAMAALSPTLADEVELSEVRINLGFFLGSIFFTAAAYLQLFQAANAGDAEGGPPAAVPLVKIGWRPEEIGWLSSFLQFVGTVLFNVSTFVTLHPSGNWLRDELTIWGPDIFGSVLFLASGYLAFAETSHGAWSWRPRDLSWWAVSVNLAGCIAFMMSAFDAFVPRSGAVASMVQASVSWTLVGALFFLAGAGLMLAESTRRQDQSER